MLGLQNSGDIKTWTFYMEINRKYHEEIGKNRELHNWMSGLVLAWSLITTGLVLVWLFGLD